MGHGHLEALLVGISDHQWTTTNAAYSMFPKREHIAYQVRQSSSPSASAARYRTCPRTNTYALSRKSCGTQWQSLLPERKGRHFLKLLQTGFHLVWITVRHFHVGLVLSRVEPIFYVLFTPAGLLFCEFPFRHFFCDVTRYLTKKILIVHFFARASGRCK